MSRYWSRNISMFLYIRFSITVDWMLFRMKYLLLFPAFPSASSPSPLKCQFGYIWSIAPDTFWTLQNDSLVTYINLWSWTISI
jgi:hypothetical protein